MATRAYFENIKDELVKQLNSSQKSIKVAVAWFTDSDLFEILCKKAKKGIRVEVFIANHYTNHNSKIDYEELNNCGGQFCFIGEGSDMHHKFCIIDNAILIHGSYNWTYKAKSNNESITVINGDNQIILDYYDEFDRLRFNKNLNKDKYLLDYSPKMNVSKGTNAELYLIKAILGEFPKVIKSKDSDIYYIPESEIIKVALELGVFD